MHSCGIVGSEAAYSFLWPAVYKAPGYELQRIIPCFWRHHTSPQCNVLGVRQGLHTSPQCDVLRVSQGHHMSSQSDVLRVRQGHHTSPPCDVLGVRQGHHTRPQCDVLRVRHGAGSLHSLGTQRKLRLTKLRPNSDCGLRKLLGFI